MKWILGAILAILLCGCLENEANFDALNLGKISATYANKMLAITQDSSDNSDFMLFFFTSTCGVCKEQIPILEELSQNIRIYGILGDISNTQKAQYFIESSKITMPIFYQSNARRFLANASNGIKGVPVIVVFKNGKVAQKFIGLTPKGILASAF